MKHKGSGIDRHYVALSKEEVGTFWITPKEVFRKGEFGDWVEVGTGDTVSSGRVAISCFVRDSNGLLWSLS